MRSRRFLHHPVRAGVAGLATLIGAFTVAAPAWSTPTQFTAGDLVVYETQGTSSASQAVSLVDYSTSGTPSGFVVNLPTADSGSIHALTESGAALNDSELTDSADGQSLVATGSDASVGVASMHLEHHAGDHQRREHCRHLELYGAHQRAGHPRGVVRADDPAGRRVARRPRGCRPSRSRGASSVASPTPGIGACSCVRRSEAGPAGPRRVGRLGTARAESGLVGGGGAPLEGALALASGQAQAVGS